MPTPPREKLQEILESRILRGLQAEWESLTWMLSPFQQTLLRRPLFTLRDMRSRLGYWAAEKNEIALSRHFVHNYSWNDVCEVLRHEVAHQVVCQVMGVYDQRPHGPAFQEACVLLRADPRAASSYHPLSERLKQAEAQEQDSILRKVHKLLALAESANQHEAEAAMAKANNLIAKYNIRLLEAAAQREYVSAFVGRPALKHFREDYRLAHLLEDYYFVKGLWVTAYVLEKGKMGRVLEISGTPANVLIASYVHDVVKHFMDAEWRRYTRFGKLSRSRKTDFAVGIIEGFSSRLQQQQEQTRAAASSARNSRELITLDDPQLDTYIQKRYPSVRSFRRKGTRSDPTVMADGRRRGADLVISRGVTLRPDNQIHQISN